MTASHHKIIRLHSWLSLVLMHCCSFLFTGKSQHHYLFLHEKVIWMTLICSHILSWVVDDWCVGIDWPWTLVPACCRLARAVQMQVNGTKQSLSHRKCSGSFDRILPVVWETEATCRLFAGSMSSLQLLIKCLASSRETWWQNFSNIIYQSGIWPWLNCIFWLTIGQPGFSRWRTAPHFRAPCLQERRCWLEDLSLRWQIVGKAVELSQARIQSILYVYVDGRLRKCSSVASPSWPLCNVSREWYMVRDRMRSCNFLYININHMHVLHRNELKWTEAMLSRKVFSGNRLLTALRILATLCADFIQDETKDSNAMGGFEIFKFELAWQEHKPLW